MAQYAYFPQAFPQQPEQKRICKRALAEFGDV